MKASTIRKLAKTHSLDALARGAEAIAEREVDELGVDGEDLGEKLTHIMLAMRIVERVQSGEELKNAFREEMAAVRHLLENE